MVMRKGALLTIDALMALAFFLTSMLLILSMFPGMRAPLFPENHLRSISLDTLAVLSESGRASALASRLNSSAVREVLEALPAQICMEIEIRNMQNGRTLTALSRSGCTEAPNGVQTAYRNFRAGTANYLMIAKSWQRPG